MTLQNYNNKKHKIIKVTKLQNTCQYLYIWIKIYRVKFLFKEGGARDTNYVYWYGTLFQMSITLFAKLYRETFRLSLIAG